MQYLWLNEEEFINKTSRKFRCMAFLDGVELKGKIIKFKYHQASNAESYLCLGSSCSAYLEIDYLGNETILPGKTIRLFVDINRSNGHIPPYYGMVSLGPHSITKVEKNGNTVSILAYDDLSAVSNTIGMDRYSVGDFTNTYMRETYGIDILATYVNDDFYEQITSYNFKTSTKNMKDKELLGYSAQLYGMNVIPHNGGYGFGEKKTIYEYRWYDEHFGVYKITPDHIYEFKKNGDLYSLDKLECIVEKEVNGETVKEKLKAGLGTGGISFSNPFMTQDILNKIYGFMGGLVYQPCTLKILGDPRLEVGDIVTVVDTDGKEYKVPIMAMDLEYDGGITTTITAYGGSDGMSSSSGPTAQAIEKVYVKMYEADQVLADKVTAAEGEIKKLSGDYLDFKEGEFEALKSDTAEFKNTTTESLKAINADVETINGKQAIFEDTTTKNFSAVTARIETVSGDFAGFKTGEFETLKSKQANFEEATAQKFTAVTGQVDSINGQFADYKVIVNEEFTSIHSTIKILDVESQRVKELLAGNITSENIATGAITAGSGIIANGAIGDAEISNLSANKIKSGTVDTSLVTIASKDSAITITGNQLMVNDTTNAANPINRVILGKYTSGSTTTYGLLIRGKDGKTVMLDGDGVHNAGITNGAIDNNKVADDANISGNKLDINSVVRSVNGATEKIQSTVVQVGDISLNVYLGEQTNTIASNYTALQGYANTKADDALKDAKSYADGVVEGVSIGGRNLLLDSGHVIENSKFLMIRYKTSYLKPNTKYTFVINGNTNTGNKFAIFFNNGEQPGAYFRPASEVTTQYITVQTPDTLTDTMVNVYNHPYSTATNATLNWACMYEGDIKPPLDWSPAPEDTQAQFEAVMTSLTEQSQKLLEQTGIINSQGQLLAGHTATIQTQSETLKSHEASIKANQDSIKLKVDTQTYTSDKTAINTSISDNLKDAKSYADTKKTEAVSAAATDAKAKADKALADSKTFTNAEITKVNTSLSKATADITILQGQITSKVEQTDINKSVETVKLYVDGEVGKAIEDTTESIKTAKSEIKQTTDAITQNVSNLQTTVSTHTTQIGNKAETSTVTAISNRTASLETKLTGITGKVTDYVSTTVTDSTKDLVTGLETVNGSIETINSKQANFELTLSGFATDVSNLEKTVEKKADGSALSTLSNTVSGLSSNLDGFKTSVSSTYTTKTELSNTLGSYSTTKQMNSAIEATKTAITSAVSETYSTKAELTSATGKITALETWKQEASQKITKDGIVATVGTYYVKDTDLTAAENRITAAESTISQHAKEIALKVTENGVSSLIQQWYNGITIQAQKINLNGLVTANNNFKILEDGSIEVKNGKFSGNIDAANIVGGTITNGYSGGGELLIENGTIVQKGEADISGEMYDRRISILQGALHLSLSKNNCKTSLSGSGLSISQNNAAGFYADANRMEAHGQARFFGDICEGNTPIKDIYSPKTHAHTPADIIDYATCATTANTVSKLVNISGFTLVAGARITVKFTYGINVNDATLNVSGTGAKNIYYKNRTLKDGAIASNTTVELVYTGSYWDVIGELNNSGTAQTFFGSYNLNSYTIPGKYIIHNNGEAWTNTPTSWLSSWVEILSNGDVITQIMTEYNGRFIFVRGSYRGSWSAWKTYASNGS